MTHRKRHTRQPPAESIAESVERRLLEDFFTRNNPRLRALAVKHEVPWGDSERLLEVAQHHPETRAAAAQVLARM
jgi:hypothetical protein